jgi:imidazole glycerol-phosphate synthase subunit HisH
MIGIIDYGVGNVRAFLNVFNRLGVVAKRVNTSEDISEARSLILPGVGSFDHAMTALNNSGIRETLELRVLQDHTPILGVCVGMQMLAQTSDEGKLPGLGWLPASVKNLDGITDKPLPHMGWNNISFNSKCPLFKGFEDSPLFYFLHSYYFSAININDVMAQTNYGTNFGCVVQKGNIFGVQYHPEKSHKCGELLLKNFSEL